MVTEVAFNFYERIHINGVTYEGTIVEIWGGGIGVFYTILKWYNLCRITVTNILSEHSEFEKIKRFIVFKLDV